MGKKRKQGSSKQQINPKEYVVRIFGPTRDGDTYNGTGFLLNSDGHVATCWHVVEEADEIFVKLPHMSEWIYDVLDRREREDIAVLVARVQPELKTPYATLHPEWFERAKVGKTVEMYGYSDADNVDMALRCKCNISGISNQHGLIMLDGHVNPGDSGGPILNLDGDVIGMANYKDSREGHAMARPISRLHKFLIDIDLTFGVRGSGKFAKRAIDSLVGLMDDQRVRSAVVPYSAIFEKSSEQISTLHAYKKVHDLLYKVEGCYNMMVIDARDFPHHELAREKMSIHLDNLKIYLSSAEEIASGAIERRDRIEKVRNQLREVCNSLEKAEQLLDLAPCSRALYLLNQLLSRTQSTFNVLLNETARELHIASLVAALQTLQEVLSGMQLPSTTVQEFQLGINELAELGQNLQEGTTEHDNWQQLDDELRGINRNSSDLLSEIEVFWPTLNSYVEIICNPPATGGTVATPKITKVIDPIMQETTNIKTALDLRDLARVRRHLGSLRQRAADRFDRVDQKLLQICEKITKVKYPLQTLVNNL
jgi:hypothetical protein